MRAVAPVLLILALSLAVRPAVAAGKSEEEKASMSLYNKGRTLFDAGDWAGAEDLFMKSLAVYANPYARLYRAASLGRLGRCDESRAELARFSPEQVAPKAREKAKAMAEEVRASCAAVPPAPAPAAPATAPPAPAAPAPAAGSPAPSHAPGDSPPAGAAPAPVATDKGRSKGPVAGRPIVVSLEGTGDFIRIEEALAKAKPGALIHLNSGLHRLSKPLDLAAPVRLVGDGKGATIVAGDGEGHVIRFLGKGPFEVHDLAIEHQGSRPARVVIVDGGAVDFRGLKISGGARDAVARQGGDGLLLKGDATGAVTACEFVGNALHGITLTDTAHPVLEGNSSRGNGKGGIVWFGESGGTAKANICSSNGQYGIAVVDKAAPRLVGNACADNGRGGMYLEDGRNVPLLDNRCEMYRVR